MNEIPKVVFSDSLASAEWGPTTIARGDLAAAVTRLKQERPDGYLLAQGGVRFASSLVKTGLIDEYRLVIHPVVLGQQELDRGPVQAEADFDITRDLRRAEIKDEDAGTDADVELARAGPAAQALGDAVVNVHARGFPLGSGLGGHSAVHAGGLLFGSDGDCHRH